MDYIDTNAIAYVLRGDQLVSACTKRSQENERTN